MAMDMDMAMDMVLNRRCRNDIFHLYFFYK